MHMPERSFAAPRVFSDDWIEHWARVYLDPRANALLRARRVSFETFLIAPREILAAARRPTVGLLPAQRDVRRRIDLACAVASAEYMHERFIELHGCFVRAGAALEKLKHHAWPRRRGRKTHLTEM